MSNNFASEMAQAIADRNKAQADAQNAPDFIMARRAWQRYAAAADRVAAIQAAQS